MSRSVPSSRRPAANAERAPSSNRQRRKALKARRRRRAEREPQTRPQTDPAVSRLRRARRGTRNPVEAIRRMAEGEAFDLPRLSYLGLVQDILHAARGRDVVDAALRLVHAALGTKLLADNPGPARDSLHNAFLHLAEREDAWIRRPRDWHPARKQPLVQLSELIRHLVASYPVPRVFDEAWTLSDWGPQAVELPRFQGWFLHVARGQNLRTAPDLPFPLTKRMAHFTLEADPELGLARAMRYGQARAAGLDERVATAFVATRAGDAIDVPGGPAQNEFWGSVLRFLARQGMLDPDCVHGLVDYLIDQRYGSWRRTAAHRAPARPNLSMKGQSLEGLLARANAWHKETQKVTRVRPRQWTGLGLLVPEHGRTDAPGCFTWRTRSREGTTTWSVEELLQSQELAEEGHALGHCVVTYAWSCEQGRSSIWSVRRMREGRVENRATIEVHPPSRAIVQARGPRNQTPTATEWAVIERFARAAGLRLPRRLRAPDVNAAP